ncbi:Abhydrolase_3 domain-containing protein [Agreia sp. COWG]|nr:Abhydrolase_3 domain-containing protein [Agreia sp. COWG]
MMETLAPGMRRLGKILGRLPGASIANTTPEQLAKRSEAKTPELAASILMGTSPKGVAKHDRTASGVPVRVYTPKGSQPERQSGGPARAASPGHPVRPLIVYFHGGGFVFGDLRGGDWMCGTVARDLDAVVVSVDYRLAPKHPFPAAVDDCYATLLWAAEHAEELGADASKLGVMGDSAGANLATVAALMARDSGDVVVSHQALLYPSVGAGDTESRRQNADGYILTGADMMKFGELYGGPYDDWRVSPIVAPSLAGLPSTLIEVGGHDPLHDDGVLYAQALEKAGVEVELIEYEAMPHGFLSFPRFARDARAGMAAVVVSQRRALS